jgi:hypothetical protein
VFPVVLVACPNKPIPVLEVEIPVIEVAAPVTLMPPATSVISEFAKLVLPDHTAIFPLVPLPVTCPSILIRRRMLVSPPRTVFRTSFFPPRLEQNDSRSRDFKRETATGMQTKGGLSSRTMAASIWQEKYVVKS